MHRKITRTGPATLTLALPAKWTKKNNLLPGQELELEEHDNNLIISVQKNKSNETKRILYDEFLLENMLEKLYMDHTPQITIFSEQNLPQSIYSIIKKFPGLKIIEETKTKLELYQVLEPCLRKESVLLRRIYLLLKQSFETNYTIKKDLRELFFLIGLQNKDSRESEILLMIFNILSSIKHSFFDELYGYMKSIFDLLYLQKYSFTKYTAIKIDKLFSKQEKLFSVYYKKENPLIVGKLYHCLQLFHSLNRIIITNQSLDLLQSNTMKSKKEFVVGVCLKSNSNVFWRGYVRNGMEEAQKKYSSIDVIYKAPYIYPDIPAQEKIIDELIIKGVDLIILAPLHPTKLNDSLKKIERAGIQLILIDTTVNSDVKYTYIGWDNFKGGVLTANYLKTFLKPKSNLLVVEGQTEGNFHERVSGFESILSAHSITVISADFQKSEAYKKTFTYLKTHAVDAIFATSDNMALGVLEATQELGKQIPICSFDATDAVIELVSKKKILSTVTNKPSLLGSLAIETAYKMLRKKQVPKKMIYDVDIIT